MLKTDSFIGLFALVNQKAMPTAHLVNNVEISYKLNALILDIFSQSALNHQYYIK